jgi:hypothetical protein
MRRFIRVSLAYAPISLSVLQLLFCQLYFMDRQAYQIISFYVSNIIGQSVVPSLVMLALSYSFDFCSVSRFAAWAQVVNCVLYIAIKEDNVYNVSLQYITLCVALIATLYAYTRKFPNCRVSYLWSFMRKLIKHGSCTRSLIDFKEERYHARSKQAGHSW